MNNHHCHRLALDQGQSTSSTQKKIFFLTYMNFNACSFLSRRQTIHPSVTSVWTEGLLLFWDHSIVFGFFMFWFSPLPTEKRTVWMYCFKTTIQTPHVRFNTDPSREILRLFSFGYQLLTNSFLPLLVLLNHIGMNFWRFEIKKPNFKFHIC